MNNKRINKYEKMYDTINDKYQALEKAFQEFSMTKELFNQLDKYYGSEEWYQDIDYYDKNRPNVKAGVLSEDCIWNLEEDIHTLFEEMNNYYKDIKKE